MPAGREGHHRCTPPEVAAMASEYDSLVDLKQFTGARRVAERIMCYELRRLTGKPCGKKRDTQQAKSKE